MSHENQPSKPLYGAIGENQPPAQEQKARTNMEADKRKIIIVGASIATVIVLLLVILSLVFTLNPGQACNLVGERPLIDLEPIKPIPSQNNKALVRFAGFLEVFVAKEGAFGESKFIELKLQSVKYSAYSQGRHRLELDMDCASMSIQILKHTEIRTYFFDRITIRPKAAAAKFEECQISNLSNSMRFSFAQYYSCELITKMDCNTFGGNEVYLKIDSIDLEVEGNPRQISHGEFSKNPSGC